MKNNRIYIILIAILIIFAILMYILVGKNNLENRKKEVTLIFGEDVIFRYQNNNWTNIENDSVKKAYDWRKFSIYLNGTYEGVYYAWHDNKWQIFDNNKQALNYDGNLLGIDTNINIRVKPFEILNSTDDTFKNQILKNHGILENAKLTVNTVTNIDIDNDGREESIYIISNAFPIDFSPNNIFSYVYMVKDNKIYTIYEYQETEEISLGNQIKPYIYSILDVNEDGVYEILLAKARYSEQKPIYTLYKLEKNLFKALVSDEK